MSLEKIHLRKLLQIFYAPNNKRVDILRRDIRSEIKKKGREQGPEGRTSIRPSGPTSKITSPVKRICVRSPKDALRPTNAGNGYTPP
jgi:hypothetical protein